MSWVGGEGERERERDRQTDRQDGWMDGWMDGWIDRQIDKFRSYQGYLTPREGKRWPKESIKEEVVKINPHSFKGQRAIIRRGNQEITRKIGTIQETASG